MEVSFDLIPTLKIYQDHLFAVLSIQGNELATIGFDDYYLEDNKAVFIYKTKEITTIRNAEVEIMSKPVKSYYAWNIGIKE